MQALDYDAQVDSLPSVGATTIVPDFYYATGGFSSLIDTTIDTTSYTSLVKFDYANMVGASGGSVMQLYVLWASTIQVKIVEEDIMAFCEGYLFDLIISAFYESGLIGMNENIKLVSLKITKMKAGDLFNEWIHFKDRVTF